MASNYKNSLLPVYTLVGTDKLKIKYILNRLEKRLSEYGDMTFNTSRFEGENVSGAEIAQACMQMPFASEKRYVLVKNADKLNKTDNESIINYLTNPSVTTVLVLVYSKLARSTKVYKACAKISSTSIIECTPPKKYKIAEGLKAVAQSHGASINFDAANKLVELIGEDTMQLDAEIQKLILSNGGKTITIQQVELEVAKSADIKPWDFTNAFATRDTNKCLELFHQMQSGSEYFLLQQTCKIIKELICVKNLGQNATQNAISQELGYESWRVKNHYMWASNFSKKELLDNLEKALECDKLIKSTSNSAITFETFILESLKR